MQLHLILPFLVLTLFFFYANPTLDRGEYGTFIYTITKILPILAISAVAFFVLPRPAIKISCGLSKLDYYVNYAHPAGLTFFLSAMGDLFLANRSNSMFCFSMGVLPFGLAHYFNTKYYTKKFHSNSGQRYWMPALIYIFGHSVALGLATLDDIFHRTDILFQILSGVYAIVLAWTVWTAVSNWHFDTNRNRDMTTFFYMIGYVSFMFSDSILMFDEFAMNFRKAQMFCLITYYGAQGLIFLSFLFDDGKVKK